MQDYQRKLLQLLKEIDAICREHNITYYCSGGTVIGAVRHEGFIPWDDDIDVCMMRRDFERFCEVFRTNPPEGRYLLYNENDPDYHSTIPRYVEADTTSFCRYHLLGEVPAGASIDIFILESVPDDPSLQKDFIRKFFVYSDFVMPFYCFSHRVPDEYIDDYAKYRLLADEEGELAVINRLHDELFRNSPDSSEYVCLLWASSPSIFPRKIFGAPVRLRFEDADICVPSDWYRYLVLEYGMDWMQVPYSDVQEGHITINRLDMSYEHCYKVRDELFAKEELEEAFRERKTATFEYEKRHRPLLAARAKIKADAIMLAMQNDLLARSITPEQLYESGDIDAIMEVFTPYLDIQLSRWFIGSRTRFHYYRYMYPLIIDVPDEYLSVLLDTLFRKGRFRDLYKLLEAYKKAGRSNVITENAGKILEYYQIVESNYYYGKYGECLNKCDDCKYDQISSHIDQFRHACTAMLLPEKVIDRYEAGLLSREIFYNKGAGDAYFQVRNIERAKELYEDVLSDSRNGMFWNDIKRKTGQSPQTIFGSAPYSPVWFTRIEKKLLDEIVFICTDNNISYMLSPFLAEKLVSQGNLGYGTERKTIYMTVENARRFVSAFESKPPEGRSLLSWKNDPRIDEFVLEYMLRDSISVNLRDIRRTAERGIGITIRILRNGSPYSPQNLYMRSLEHKANEDSARKPALFDYVMKHGSGSAGGDYYYYIDRPGKRPVRKVVGKDIVDDPFELALDGISYTVPRSSFVVNNNASPEKKHLPENYFYSEDLSRDEFMDIVCSSGLNDIDMVDYDHYASISKAADAKVDGIWESIVSLEREYHS